MNDKTLTSLRKKNMYSKAFLRFLDVLIVVMAIVLIIMLFSCLHEFRDITTPSASVERFAGSLTQKNNYYSLWDIVSRDRQERKSPSPQITSFYAVSDYYVFSIMENIYTNVGDTQTAAEFAKRKAELPAKMKSPYDKEPAQIDAYLSTTSLNAPTVSEEALDVLEQLYEIEGIDPATLSELYNSEDLDPAVLEQLQSLTEE